MHQRVSGRTGSVPLILLVALCVTVVGCDGMSGSDPSSTFSSEQGWHRDAIQFNDQNRSFRYYVPTTLPDDAPVVLALHGATRGADTMFDETVGGGSREWIEIAEEEGILLLVPNASHSTQPVWNDCTPLPSRGRPDDAGFLIELSDWTTSRADVDPDRFYVYGVSNGGHMANRLAIEHPTRFAGIASLISNITASLGPDAECPMPSAPIPALVVSGTEDQITPYDGGQTPDPRGELLSAPDTRDLWVENNQGDPSQRTVRQLDGNNDGTSTVSCETTPAPDTGADVRLCSFEGGHTVPTLEHVTPGESASDAEGARLAWRFFRDH